RPAMGRPVEKTRTETTTAAPRGPLFSATEWKRMAAVLVFFVFATLFWAAYEQAASTLNLFVDHSVERTVFGWEIPASWFLSFPAFLVIVFAPVLAWLWVKLGPREPTPPAKFAAGLLLVGLSFVLLLPAGSMAQSAVGMKVSALWLVVAYFLQVIGELCLSPV